MHGDVLLDTGIGAGTGFIGYFFFIAAEFSHYNYLSCLDDILVVGQVILAAAVIPL